MKNSPELIKFIEQLSELFWFVPENKKLGISIEVVVETVLNYGNEKDVKMLFELIGLNETAKIFRHQISLKRNNYFPQTRNYFSLYFNKYA